MKINMFGLLHLNDTESTAVNVKIRDFRDQISIYVANAISLSASLQARGIPFTLLTNNKVFVEECAAAFSQPLLVEEIPFTTPVPAGIRFYSAHFKLDAFRHLASLGEGYFALCDLDMLCINSVPHCLENIVRASIPLCYDISDQEIPAYGHEVMVHDLQAMHGLESEGRWMGGEFIAGPAAFFGALTTEIDRIYPNYIAGMGGFHHVGDEAFTSAAIEVLKRQGMYIADAGTLGLVGRFWSTDILHPQKPYAWFRQGFLLHMPADKRLLMELARRGEFSLAEFDRLYARRRHEPVLLARKLVRAIQRMMSQAIAP